MIKENTDYLGKKRRKGNVQVVVEVKGTRPKENFKSTALHRTVSRSVSPNFTFIPSRWLV